VTNGAGGANIAATLIYPYMDRYYPVTTSPSAAPSADFASRVTPYLGTYYTARRNFTTFEKLMGGLPPYDLSLDAQDNLILSVMGQPYQLEEVQPGLLRFSEDADIQFVLQTDESGQAYLLSSDPWDYIKVPWYGTTRFRDLLNQQGLLLFLGSLIAWGFAALLGLRKHQPRPFHSHLARWVGALFGAVMLVLFVGVDLLMNTKDPVFGYPVILIDKPPIFYIIMSLPYILAGLGVLMLVFTLLAWTRRYWSWGGRLHYTLLTISGLSVLWGLWYWNLLL
jgi:hypothetical protein